MRVTCCGTVMFANVPHARARAADRRVHVNAFTRRMRCSRVRRSRASRLMFILVRTNAVFTWPATSRDSRPPSVRHACAPQLCSRPGPASKYNRPGVETDRPISASDARTVVFRSDVTCPVRLLNVAMYVFKTVTLIGDRLVRTTRRTSVVLVT